MYYDYHVSLHLLTPTMEIKTIDYRFQMNFFYCLLITSTASGCGCGVILSGHNLIFGNETIEFA